MECWLLATLPINTGLLLTRQGFHFTNCSNLSFLKSLIGDQSGCHTVGPLVFINNAIRMANPVWHCSSSVCHGYPSSQDGQSQRNFLSSLPESTPKVASQNLVFLWTAHHSASESLLKLQDFIPLLVYSNDKKPADTYTSRNVSLTRSSGLTGAPLFIRVFKNLHFTPKTWFFHAIYFHHVLTSRKTGALNDLGSYWVF